MIRNYAYGAYIYVSAGRNKEMTVATPALNEPFKIEIVKSLVANPAIRWRNTYEGYFGGEFSGVGFNGLIAAANKILAFERAIHLTAVSFIQHTVSTYIEDGEPYAPDSFVTTPIAAGTLGTRPSDGGDAQPLRVALYVRRLVQFGRQGKLFYRGVLQEGDVSASAGTAFLTNAGAMQTLVNDALVLSGVDDMLVPTLTLGGFKLAIVGATATASWSARPVMGLVAAGVTIISNDHRYYDVA